MFGILRLFMFDVYYKAQKIMSLNGNMIGVEILMDPKKTDNKKYENILKDYRYTLSLVSRIINALKYNKKLRRSSYGISLFINVEFEHLKYIKLLTLIIKLQLDCIKYGSRLVIEITERQPKNITNAHFNALKMLREMQVLIAVDDFDIKCDYRYDLLNSGYFDIIKIEWVSDKAFDIELFLSEFRNYRVVIEKVEDIRMLDVIHKPNEIWGVQGFCFCKGMSIEI